MAGFWKQLKNALQGNSIARNEARESARRRLRMELLEGRELFAADIQGTVFHDFNNDTQLSPGDTPLSGVVVQLFQDNGDGVYGPSDTLKDSATSAGNGGYTLTAESVGNYFPTALPNASLNAFKKLLSTTRISPSLTKLSSTPSTQHNKSSTRTSPVQLQTHRSSRLQKPSEENAMFSSMQQQAPSVFLQTARRNPVSSSSMSAPELTENELFPMMVSTVLLP